MTMATLIYLNGVPVQHSGYWVDRHGHTVFVCAGQPLPTCPAYPYENTSWQLHAAVGCQHDHSPGPQAA